jgi:hypothetical protein
LREACANVSVVSGIEFITRTAHTAQARMPTQTETTIEELCARIRALCTRAHSPETEAELRKLAHDLRVAINKHVRIAKSSLMTQKSAISRRDLESKSDSDFVCEQ